MKITRRRNAAEAKRQAKAMALHETAAKEALTVLIQAEQIRLADLCWARARQAYRRSGKTEAQIDALCGAKSPSQK